MTTSTQAARDRALREEAARLVYEWPPPSWVAEWIDDGKHAQPIDLTCRTPVVTIIHARLAADARVIEELRAALDVALTVIEHEVPPEAFQCSSGPDAGGDDANGATLGAYMHDTRALLDRTAPANPKGTPT